MAPCRPVPTRLLLFLSGPASPAPPGQLNTSGAESKPSEPGERLAVRLVNGSSGCSGAVQVWLGEAWEPVCGALWDGHAPEAVCRALGCGGVLEATVQPGLRTMEPLAPTSGNASGTPNATRASLPAILCQGPEWRLCEVMEHVCNSDTVLAQVTCEENRALRLVDGGGRCAGRVEMLEHGRWGSLCDDTWDLQDAHVVCRQLGCGWAVQAVPGLHFAPGRGPIHRDQVNCSGDEAYLWDCPGLHSDSYCGHKEDAGVVCSEHQSWRLTGGADLCEGQVEVYFRGVWSTVCNSEWYLPEANVLCRALGCGALVTTPKGQPHSLSGQMYYSCTGSEPTLAHCFWRFNNPNLCSQSLAARVHCSGSHNRSSTGAPLSLQPVTVEPSRPVEIEPRGSGELILFISCIILGILLLGSLISIAFILFKVKGKYALPAMANHQHLPATAPAGISSYHNNPITIPKEEVPELPVQVQAPPPEDSSSDSDYEHYDFSAQPPVALTTFYNSQRHRVTDEEVQRSRFQMPPLEEGLQELPVSWPHLPIPGRCVADPPSLGPRHHSGHSSSSSTSSGDNYCNSPSSKARPWNSQVFSSEGTPLLPQPPNLELAGSQPILSAGPSADDSSSTSSGGEWYQNFQPPPQPPSVEQCEGPGSPSPKPDSTDDDYDDIGAT
ncbi:PREDICTED: T-cell differentiation antigen CD6 [Elephantulus edwardii]|uniref:T-cell differentiation antigen CD6 n=1 Tax=Elephantulus edwardii TaxID=28737 RepID=UPI0003F07E36|nr:PREDICTED: T-cell differentiation antigen CD6 [Elephantulus edwardii]